MAEKDIELGQLQPGDTYGNGRYKVLDNDGYIIKVVRLSDGWRLEFHSSSINYRHKVTKDN